MRGLRIGALVALAAIVAIGPARAQDGPKTPKECIDGINKAADAGDAKGIWKLIAEPASSTMARMFDASKGLTDAMKKLADAVDAKFGAGTAKELEIEVPATDLTDMKIEAAEIKENGDEATALGKKDQDGDQEKYYFKKANGVWLMDPMKEEGAADKIKELDQTSASLKTMAAKLDALATEVAAGKYETKAALKAHMESMGGGEGDKPAGGDKDKDKGKDKDGDGD